MRLPVRHLRSSNSDRGREEFRKFRLFQVNFSRLRVRPTKHIVRLDWFACQELFGVICKSFCVTDFLELHL